jgi:hypothetical protein
LNSVVFILTLGIIFQIDYSLKNDIDPKLLEISEDWKSDTLGYDGYRSNIISNDSLWLAFIGLDSTQVMEVLGEPDYVCHHDASRDYIYCFENWRGGSPNVKTNYVSRRRCSENTDNWSYITISINSLGTVSRKPTILWRG